jgi:tRNA A-37 threonylcarbamoyl transferase component Bud32
VAEHLEGCPACQANLSTMSAEDPWLTTLREPAPTDSYQEELACREAVARFRAVVCQADPAAGGHDLRQLGNYDLLQELGRGGMGVVYKARHRLIDQVVALKVLPADRLTHPQAVERFYREMKAQGRLQHAHIAAARDAGEADGRHYLVMEFVAAQNLAEVVRQHGPLGVADACELARQAALGLQYVHEQGLVHRDLKPSNLIRTPDGQVKLLDLGLARFVHGDRPASADLTESGQTLGTADYMAPEQWDDPRQADIRADIYSLGCTLFHLLTGRAPFAQHHKLSQKLQAHCTEVPPNVRQLRPEVPAPLAELVGRLLAKKPEDRPQTPAAVAAALAPFAQGSTPAPVPVSLQPAAPAGTRGRWPWLAVGAGVLAVLLGLATAALIRGARREPHTPDALAKGPDSSSGGVCMNGTAGRWQSKSGGEECCALRFAP